MLIAVFDGTSLRTLTFRSYRGHDVLLTVAVIEVVVVTIRSYSPKLTGDASDAGRVVADTIDAPVGKLVGTLVGISVKFFFYSYSASFFP